MIKILTPPPTPPLQGRGVPTEFQAAGKAAAAPLPCRGGVGGGVSNQPTQNLVEPFFYPASAAEGHTSGARAREDNRKVYLS